MEVSRCAGEGEVCLTERLSQPPLSAETQGRGGFTDGGCHQFLTLQQSMFVKAALKGSLALLQPLLAIYVTNNLALLHV